MCMCASALPQIENTAPKATGLRGGRSLCRKNALRTEIRPEGVFIFAHVRESAGPGFQPGPPPCAARRFVLSCAWGDTMKILMINGSPHPRGCTYTALHEMERVLRAAGAEVQILTVGAEQVGGCVACGGCNATGRCVRGGLVNDAIDAMETADALVLASPVHYAGISGAMSAFCDRLFYASDGWANKPCACVVSARRAGTTAALDQLVKYPMISNMPVVSSQYWPMVHGACPEDAAQDAEGLQTMRNLARNMAWLLRCIELGRQNGMEPPEAEGGSVTNFIR